VALALQFDEKGVRKAVSNIAELVGRLPGAMQKCLAYFAGCDRTLQGYEGLIAAQECLPTNDTPRRLRGRLQRARARLGGRVARSGPDPVREGLPLARPSVRVAEALHWHRAPALAPARREDDRTDPTRTSMSRPSATTWRRWS